MRAAALAGAICSATLAAPARADDCTIDFTRSEGVQSTFTSVYFSECLAMFWADANGDGLGPDPYTPHMHIFNGTQGQPWAHMSQMAGHMVGDVIKMTYDQGRAFDLTGVCLATGPMNIGLKYADGNIAVYNAVGPGCTSLSGGDNVVRVTFEGNASVNPFVDSVSIRSR